MLLVFVCKPETSLGCCFSRVSYLVLGDRVSCLLGKAGSLVCFQIHYWFHSLWTGIPSGGHQLYSVLCIEPKTSNLCGKHRLSHLPSPVHSVSAQLSLTFSSVKHPFGLPALVSEENTGKSRCFSLKGGVSSCACVHVQVHSFSVRWEVPRML